MRPREGHVIGGVAAGLAAHLGLPVRGVRIALVASIALNGFGLLLYAWLWALVPAAPAMEPAPRGAAAAPVAASAGRAARRGPPGRMDLVIGALLLIGGLALLASRLGLPVRPGLAIPLLVVCAGVVLAFSQLDEVERSRWAARTGVQTRAAGLQVLAGVMIVLLGVLLFVAQGTETAQLSRTLLSALAVLAGAALVLGPWGLRLWRDLDAERAARVREAERSDIAAHLHDSVLQTLALIQRHSSDPGEVARLARAQERDLRTWLYGGGPADPSTLAASVSAAAAEVEDVHGAVVEVVTVGDRMMDAQTAALRAAVREAVTNAARHAGGGPVRVYLECGPDGVEAFVRDRGNGFDPDSVPSDRLGIRESIVGRMERHGGSARVHSVAGEGTEVRLLLPATPDAGRSA